jgi:3-oxoacyl-[acyl-carrier protein] reductase
MVKNICLEGKTALVTGSRRGIGKAIALAFAEAGADVAVCDIAIEDGLLERTKNELNEAGSRSIAVQADISRRNDVESMTRCVLNEYGKIDILVNCAGV